MTDRSAFDELVHARSGALTRTAYLLTGNHHTAEDRPPRLRGRPASVFGPFDRTPTA